jgi:hypothetical protein
MTNVVQRASPTAAPTGSDVTGMDAGHRLGRLVFFAVVAMVIGAASLRFRSRDLARAV